eukprot:Rhum_TRINITY_DN14946_c2_g1::Rhum_TRINITY_DN14946_c2_g1_i1::g.132358::m.132358
MLPAEHTARAHVFRVGHVSPPRPQLRNVGILAEFVPEVRLHEGQPRVVHGRVLRGKRRKQRLQRRAASFRELVVVHPRKKVCCRTVRLARLLCLCRVQRLPVSVRRVVVVRHRVRQPPGVAVHTRRVHHQGGCLRRSRRNRGRNRHRSPAHVGGTTPVSLVHADAAGAVHGPVVPGRHRGGVCAELRAGRGNGSRTAAVHGVTRVHDGRGRLPPGRRCRRGHGSGHRLGNGRRLSNLDEVEGLVRGGAGGVVELGMRVHEAPPQLGGGGVRVCSGGEDLAGKEHGVAALVREHAGVLALQVEVALRRARDLVDRVTHQRHLHQLLDLLRLPLVDLCSNVLNHLVGVARAEPAHKRVSVLRLHQLLRKRLTQELQRVGARGGRRQSQRLPPRQRRLLRGQLRNQLRHRLRALHKAPHQGDDGGGRRGVGRRRVALEVRGHRVGELLGDGGEHEGVGDAAACHKPLVRQRVVAGQQRLLRALVGLRLRDVRALDRLAHVLATDAQVRQDGDARLLRQEAAEQPPHGGCVGVAALRRRGGGLRAELLLALNVAGEDVVEVQRALAELAVADGQRAVLHVRVRRLAVGRLAVCDEGAAEPERRPDGALQPPGGSVASDTCGQCVHALHHELSLHSRRRRKQRHVAVPHRGEVAATLRRQLTRELLALRCLRVPQAEATVRGRRRKHRRVEAAPRQRRDAAVVSLKRCLRVQLVRDVPQLNRAGRPAHAAALHVRLRADGQLYHVRRVPRNAREAKHAVRLQLRKEALLLRDGPDVDHAVHRGDREDVLARRVVHHVRHVAAVRLHALAVQLHLLRLRRVRQVPQGQR